jgi:hypothetical protein
MCYVGCCDCVGLIQHYRPDAVFTGAFWPIVRMGTAMECAKLSAVVGVDAIGTYAPPSAFKSLGTDEPLIEVRNAY